MSETVRNHTSGIVLSFLAGAATGAAVALLTAPQSGRETRRKLKHATEDLADRASRVAPALKAAVQRAGEAGKETFLQTIEESAIPTASTLHSSHH
jgi:gas vesicle protein